MNKIKEINLSEYVEGWERGGDPLFIYVYNNISERKWDVKKLESRMNARAISRVNWVLRSKILIR